MAPGLSLKFSAERLFDAPIITPDMDGRMGSNINGPSLIRVPDWIPNRLGRYYLYFGHHHSDYIRMAYADGLAGPWKIYSPGVLDLSRSFFTDHISSPDVHVDDERKEIRLYYHGQDRGAHPYLQYSRVATSKDGLQFTARPDQLLPWYARIFRAHGYHYAITMPGLFSRSRSGLEGFEDGPHLFGPHMRHCAVQTRGDRLYVFYTNVTDVPESILVTSIDIAGDWHDWKEEPPQMLLFPQRDYEGAALPRTAARRGAIYEPMNALRDPAIFVEGDETYLLYSVAGEYGIAIARLAVT